jgi:hypothetical protein
MAALVSIMFLAMLKMKKEPAEVGVFYLDGVQ